MAHYGTKGWYVSELKKQGVFSIEGKKLETYKAHILASHLEKVNIQKSNA